MISDKPCKSMCISSPEMKIHLLNDNSVRIIRVFYHNTTIIVCFLSQQGHKMESTISGSDYSNDLFTIDGWQGDARTALAAACTVTVQVGWFGGAVPLQEVLRVSRGPQAPATPARERSPERVRLHQRGCGL